MHWQYSIKCNTSACLVDIIIAVIPDFTDNGPTQIVRNDVSFVTFNKCHGRHVSPTGIVCDHVLSYNAFCIVYVRQFILILRKHYEQPHVIWRPLAPYFVHTQDVTPKAYTTGCSEKKMYKVYAPHLCNRTSKNRTVFSKMFGKKLFTLVTEYSNELFENKIISKIYISFYLQSEFFVDEFVEHLLYQIFERPVVRNWQQAFIKQVKHLLHYEKRTWNKISKNRS